MPQDYQTELAFSCSPVVGSKIVSAPMSIPILGAHAQMQEKGCFQLQKWEDTPVPTVRSRKPRSKLNGHARAPRDHTLTLTGEQQANRWLIFFDDHATTLTGESFHALIEMVRAHGGCAKVPRESIHRLRQEIEPVLGRQGAAAFIKTVGGAY